MKTKLNSYVVIFIENNAILMEKNNLNQYRLPIVEDTSLLKEIKYEKRDIRKDKWFSCLDRKYRIAFKNILNQKNFNPYYIFINQAERGIPNATSIHFSALLKYNYTLETYPYLFGILSTQLLLESNSKNLYDRIVFFEQKDNLSFNLWMDSIEKGLNRNSYFIAKKIIKINNGKTTKLVGYTEKLKNIDIDDMLRKANHILINTNIIYDKLLNSYQLEKHSNICINLKYGQCNYEDLLLYSKNNKNHNLIIQYFKRIKNGHLCAMYITCLILENNSNYEKEIEKLLSLNLIQELYGYEEMLSLLFYASYFILHYKYQEALEVLVDCFISYIKINFNTSTFSISQTYQFIILLFIKLIYELGLAEFMWEQDIYQEVLKNYNAYKKNILKIKRNVNEYILRAIHHFEGYRNINIKKMTFKDKIIYALKNMSKKEFDFIVEYLEEHLDEIELKKLNDILYKNIYALEKKLD